MAEEPPAGDRHEPDRRPELRASHADRDRAVEVLRDAARDGQLTASELDERVEAALTARTRSELAALTADLRAVDDRPAKVRGGDVEARFPRRSLRQWVRREPPPYQSMTG